jgi:hypothetical protein
MNKYMGLTLGVVAIICVAGCATTPLISHIQSAPPGARIEVNENNAGVAPVDVTLPQKGPHHRLIAHVTIRAYPAGPGQFEQEKQLYYNQWAPENIMFDMTQSPGPSK